MTFLCMSKRELDRFGIIQRLIGKKINGATAAALLHLSIRHIRRLKRVVHTRGISGLIHGNRGKPSNRRLSLAEHTRIITLVTKRYRDFGPTFAAEKLEERHGIIRDPKTIRTLMIAEGLWKPAPTKRQSVHRSWRPRRSHVGELVQFDGSYHRWLEGRGGTGMICLIAAIDDASGQIMHAVFGDDEGVFSVFRFWKGYLERHGKPRAVYSDKFST